jgi:hypothetical protein
MKKIAKTIITVIQVPLDYLFAVLVIPSALILRIYRRFGGIRMPSVNFDLEEDWIVSYQ